MSKRKSSAVRKEDDNVRFIKPKFMATRENITPLVPLNNLQAEYIHLINNKKMVIATGLAGTSKTYIPTVMACDMWRTGEINKIYISRPNISSSQSLGFFSGSVVEKMTNWLMPVLETMNRRLGKGVVDIAIRDGAISFLPMETIKGNSFGPDTFVIVDEAEDLTAKEAEVLVCRSGGCKMVLAGDIEQSDLGPDNGLGYLKRIVEKNQDLQKFVGFVDFNSPDHIVRSKECKAWILALRKESKKK